MKNLFWIILCIFSICQPLNAVHISLSSDPMSRDVASPHYCKEHSLMRVPEFLRKSEFLALFPHCNDKNNLCFHMDCSNCHDVATRIYEVEGEDVKTVFWYCNCRGSDCYYSYVNDEDEEFQCSFKWLPTWKRCSNLAIYSGYFDNINSIFYGNLINYLNYLFSNNKCSCYWPEVSKKARLINETAYHLINRALKENEVLYKLYEKDTLSSELFELQYEFPFSMHGLTIGLMNKNFLYTDYEYAFQHVENFFQKKSEYQFKQVSRDLDEIRLVLAALFMNLYEDCISQHPSNFISEEITFIENEFNLRNNENFKESFDAYRKRLQDFIEAYGTSYNNFPRYILNHNSSFSGCLDHFPKSLNDGSENFNLKSYHKINGNTDLSYDHHFEQLKGTNDLSHINNRKNWVKINNYLIEGIEFSQNLLYEEAIKSFNKVIELDSTCEEAYIEKALAYFELNQPENALENYYLAKKYRKSKEVNRFYSKGLDDEEEYYLKILSMNDWEKIIGYTSGVAVGSADAFIDFVPSIFDSLRGISHGLWSVYFPQIKPNATLQELEIARYAAAVQVALNACEVIKVIKREGFVNCSCYVIPELRETIDNWDKFDNRTQGYKVGYIVGRYGTEVFAPIVGVKALKNYHKLRQANVMLTLECCTTAKGSQTKILQQSLDYACKRIAVLVEAKSTNKILWKSPNVKPHVMQPKHCWDKVVKLTGNLDKDFEQVIKLLEEINIIDPQYLFRGPLPYPSANSKLNPLIHKKVHVAKYKGVEIEAHFEHYIETGETFLKNAWIVTK